jgi:hypothetical protein
MSRHCATFQQILDCASFPLTCQWLPDICSSSLPSYQVQLDGIGAAISNLQFFHKSIDKSYLQLEVGILQLFFCVWVCSLAALSESAESADLLHLLFGRTALSIRL